MDMQKTEAPAAIREMRVGNTIYRISSFYTGEKDLKTVLEQLAVTRALAELTKSVRTSD